VLEYTEYLWLEGERRVRELPAGAARRPFDRVLDELVAELRRRLGSTFSRAELAELYRSSHPWTMALAVRVAPNEPTAWEQWVADAAFNRYVRGASDWGARPAPVTRPGG
jgi:hypothetical protein